MILYLRNIRNDSIVDIECYVETEDGSSFVELHSLVDIKHYSVFLLMNPKKQIEIIRDFSDIQELRGWLWETYFLGGKNDPEKYNDIIARLRKVLQEVAEKYDLSYVED